MKVVKPKRVEQFFDEYPRAREPLLFWLFVTKKAVWNNFSELRQSFNTADIVKVKSRKSVVVFDIGGNNYRLVCAVHFDRQRVFVLRFMPHSEYDKGKWKSEL